MKSRLCLVQVVLVILIVVQALAIIILSEGALQQKFTPTKLRFGEKSGRNVGEEPGRAIETGDELPELSKESLEEGLSRVALETERGLPELSKESDRAPGVPSHEHNEGVHHPTPNPGGLILASSFSYMQDPREVHRKKPLPHILPTFENLYHFHTTVHQQRLHAIIFHDDYSFNETFVKKYTSDYVKFVRVESPTFDHGEPVIAPNDFRYVVFDKWLSANSKWDENKQVVVNGINYGWILISDLDMMFQRNPFPKLDDYAERRNISFFGSWDGGRWEDEQMRLQRRLFRNCYGHSLIKSWKKEVEWDTPNGNCGLWAGRFDDVACILNCMARQYNKLPVRGKGSKTICDMATHDYCVHYGGCFSGSKFGVYDENKVGVLWGAAAQGQNNDLFGPPYGRNKQCDWNTWAVLHNRCDWRGPICYKRDQNGELVKYHQNIRGKKCKLDPITDLPLTDLQLNETQR